MRRSPSGQIFSGGPGRPRWAEGAAFVLLLQDETIAGYHTLSSRSVQLRDLPEQTARMLPRYPLVPARLLGALRWIGSK
jgi:hypothetical protein